MSHNWLKKSSAIPAIQQAGLLDCERISGGSSNLNFKVTTQAGIWVVRFNQAQLGINRQQEQHILDLIAPLAISPKVIEINPAAGYLITEYSNQPTWRQVRPTSQDGFAKLAESLNRFHQIPYSYLPSRLDHRISNYLKVIKNIPNKLQQETLAQIEQLAQLGFWHACNTLYHSDLNPNNLLGTKTPLIIDWEYAGQGHALLDWLILEHEHQLDLSAYYPPDMNDKWLKPCKALIVNLMQLWTYNDQSLKPE